MDKHFKYALYLCAVALVFFILIPKANATEAILNGIEVKPLNNSYEIILNTDQAIPLKTESPQSDKMIIDLKNIMPSKSVNTVCLLRHVKSNRFHQPTHKRNVLWISPVASNLDNRHSIVL